MNTYPSGIPSKFLVGPVEYTVTMRPCPTAPGPEGEDVPVYGMVNFKKTEITIDDELTVVMQWQCFWHEVFHIVFEQLGMFNDDEGSTDALAYKFMEILLDNRFLQFPALETVELIAKEFTAEWVKPSSDNYIYNNLAHGE